MAWTVETSVEAQMTLNTLQNSLNLCRPGAESAELNRKLNPLSQFVCGSGSTRRVSFLAGEPAVISRWDKAAEGVNSVQTDAEGTSHREEGGGQERTYVAAADDVLARPLKDAEGKSAPTSSFCRARDSFPIATPVRGSRALDDADENVKAGSPLGSPDSLCLSLAGTPTTSLQSPYRKFSIPNEPGSNSESKSLMCGPWRARQRQPQRELDDNSVNTLSSMSDMRTQYVHGGARNDEWPHRHPLEEVCTESLLVADLLARVVRPSSVDDGASRLVVDGPRGFAAAKLI